MGQDFWGPCFKENKILKYNQLLVDRRVKGLANTEDISSKKRGMKDMRIVRTQTKVATLEPCTGAETRRGSRGQRFQGDQLGIPHKEKLDFKHRAWYRGGVQLLSLNKRMSEQTQASQLCKWLPTEFMNSLSLEILKQKETVEQRDECITLLTQNKYSLQLLCSTSSFSLSCPMKKQTWKDWVSYLGLPLSLLSEIWSVCLQKASLSLDSHCELAPKFLQTPRFRASIKILTIIIQQKGTIY